MVSFIIEGSTRLDSCTVSDISPEGAQLIGRAKLKNALKLAPLTFTLGMRYSSFEKVIIVSEASVVRLRDKGDGLTEYGLHPLKIAGEQRRRTGGPQPHLRNVRSAVSQIIHQPVVHGRHRHKHRTGAILFFFF